MMATEKEYRDWAKNPHGSAEIARHNDIMTVLQAILVELKKASEHNEPRGWPKFTPSI